MTSETVEVRILDPQGVIDRESLRMMRKGTLHELPLAQACALVKEKRAAWTCRVLPLRDGDLAIDVVLSKGVETEVHPAIAVMLSNRGAVQILDLSKVEGHGVLTVPKPAARHAAPPPPVHHEESVELIVARDSLFLGNGHLPKGTRFTVPASLVERYIDSGAAVVAHAPRVRLPLVAPVAPSVDDASLVA